MQANGFFARLALQKKLFMKIIETKSFKLKWLKILKKNEYGIKNKFPTYKIYNATDKSEQQMLKIIDICINVDNLIVFILKKW